tara:strand:+ start:3597 stop:4022 length:426 start_codon:yes stop_codon:yes gene_type:complete
MEDSINKNAVEEYKTNILFETIEEVTGLKKETIISKGRVQDIAIARNIAGYIIHKGIGLTTVATAKIINRDHSTVVYYNKMFDTNYNYYKEYRELYNIVTELFWSKFVTTEKEEIDLQVKSLQALIAKLKKRTEYLLIKNN